MRESILISVSSNYQHDYYLKNKAKKKSYLRDWYKKNRTRQLEYQERYYTAIKYDLINHYSDGTNMCACCGEARMMVLTIEHLNGGGRLQRRTEPSVNGGHVFYRWLIRNNYPVGYAVLCFNCNFAKGVYRFCSHQGESTIKLSIDSQRRRREKQQVIAHYSNGTNACAHCSETHLEFLTTDHIHGKGTAHRRSVGRGSIYKWLIDNNYPDGFQVLCMNCNIIKYRLGSTKDLLA